MRPLEKGKASPSALSAQSQEQTILIRGDKEFVNSLKFLSKILKA